MMFPVDASCPLYCVINKSSGMHFHLLMFLISNCFKVYIAEKFRFSSKLDVSEIVSNLNVVREKYTMSR
jgi:hypothetical protein